MASIHEEVKETRASHIDKIICKLNLSQSTLIPTATEEQLLEEALRHVVHVVTTKEYIHAPPEGCNRKERLKNILDQLRWMERKRLYDPPADNEMGHYLLIKKYLNWIKAFHLRDSNEKYESNLFGCTSLIGSLRHAQDLVELNQHLKDLSDFLLGMNTENLPNITPLMSTKEDYKMDCVINGSKERNYMFYKHKFKLALVDLKYTNSEFTYSPPLEDEERSYVQAFNGISSPLIEPKVGFTEELLNLYNGRIHQEYVDLERHITIIKDWILNRLPITVKEYETICRDESIYDDTDEEELAKVGKELIKKCEVSNEKLLDYISQVDNYLTIALLVETLIHSRMTGRPGYGAYMTLYKAGKKLGWEFAHALTLSKHGCSAGCVLQEQPILQNLQKFVPLENHHASRKRASIVHGEDQYNNFTILEKIIDDLKRIGDSDVVLDEEEMALVHKIWGSVASSTHFFVSAMAYEQRRYIMQNYKKFDLNIPGLSALKSMVPSVDWRTVYGQDHRLYSAHTLATMLKTYKTALIKKLRSIDAKDLFV